MHLRCQTPLFFAPLSVAKSYRYGCRDLQHRKCRRKSLRRDVDNCHHHSWNQHLAPAVAESTAPVAKLISFAAAGAPACYLEGRPPGPGVTSRDDAPWACCRLAVVRRSGTRRPGPEGTPTGGSAPQV